MQIYLLLFLKQLSGKLGPDDAGWDVPWGGMDQTQFAQYLLFLTLVLLPCAAIALLGGRATLQITADYHHKTAHFGQFTSPLWKWSPLVLAKMALILVTLAVSIVSAILSWKYRPRIKREPSLPSQPDSGESPD